MRWPSSRCPPAAPAARPSPRRRPPLRRPRRLRRRPPPRPPRPRSRRRRHVVRRRGHDRRARPPVPRPVRPARPPRHRHGPLGRRPGPAPDLPQRGRRRHRHALGAGRRRSVPGRALRARRRLLARHVRGGRRGAAAGRHRGAGHRPAGRPRPVRPPHLRPPRTWPPRRTSATSPTCVAGWTCCAPCPRSTRTGSATWATAGAASSAGTWPVCARPSGPTCSRTPAPTGSAPTRRRRTASPPTPPRRSAPRLPAPTSSSPGWTTRSSRARASRATRAPRAASTRVEWLPGGHGDYWAAPARPRPAMHRAWLRAPPLTTLLAAGFRRPAGRQATCGRATKGVVVTSPRGGVMRKPVVTSVLVLLLLLAVVVAAAGLGGAATAPPAQAGPAASSSHWCNFVLAGKDATADGSVLMGYNNDWSANNYVYMQVVPGDATHNQYVRLLTWGGVPEGGINVHQLGVNYGTATTLDAAVLAADPYVKKGYGGEIWDTILQQCTTAQQAITLLGQMAQTGFTSGAAGSFGIADPERGLGLRAARRPPLGRAARAGQRRPRAPQHRDRPPDRPRRPRQLPRLGRPAVLRPEHRPLRPRRAAPSTSPGPTTTATCCSRTTTPTGSGARSTRVAPSLGLDADDALRRPARVRGARRPGHAPGHPGHLPLPLRGHEPSTRRRTTR